MRSMGIELNEHGGLRYETEVVLSHRLPPVELVNTAFATAFAGDRLLMVRLADRGWHPPGGHREPGESPVEAAVREVREEAGVDIRWPLPLATQRVTLLDQRPAGHRYPYPTGYQTFFVAFADRCADPTPGTEAVAARFFDPDEARGVDWVQRHQPLYEEALRRATAPAKIDHDGVPMAADPPGGAQVVVVRHTRRGPEFLVLHRRGAPDDGDWAWTSPSGCRFPGEAIEACARRELREEAGLDLDPLPLPGAPTEWARYWVEVDAATTVALDDEHDRYEWVDLDEALTRCLPARTAEAFDTVAALLRI
jgi:8-oxo-dGTP diphosphatase